MKKLRVALCALLVLCASFAFAACGDKKSTFDVSQISLDKAGITDVTYDGNTHVFAVNYPGVENLSVTYAKDKNGEFRPANQTNFVAAGDYSVFYKLSADGYESYISPEPISFTIAKRPVNVNVASEFRWNKHTDYAAFSKSEYQWSISGANVPVGSDCLAGVFTIDSSFDPETAEAGQEYDVQVSFGNANYLVNGGAAVTTKLLVVDNVVVEKGAEKKYFSTLEAALADELATEDATITLYNDITLKQNN